MEITTLYSAASIASVPRVGRSSLGSVFQQPGNTTTPTTANSAAMIPRSMSPIPSELVYHLQQLQRSHMIEETTIIHPLRTSRASFEERDMAPDAVPLSTTPDEIIHGDRELVRCAMLNDRMHVVTVDTCGEVAVWDVVRGVCVGRFEKGDVSEACICESSKSEGGEGSAQGEEVDRSPREALEVVKERIEGEAVVANWAGVDTKTGLLTVHLNERCFEAEVYADEAGFTGGDRRFGDETRSKCYIFVSYVCS